eukprot:m.63189 g.63189  ORF g.63189 m.63189 type:complete len:54 (-) comp12455_c0_seq3:300-461(-)
MTLEASELSDARSDPDSFAKGKEKHEEERGQETGVDARFSALTVLLPPPIQTP